MSEYFLHYAESNICCAVIFGIMLAHDLMSVDRQEKQIKFDRVLAAFIAYFISDVFWAAVITGTIPKTIFSASLTNISNLVLMILITYCWFNYAMAVLQSPNRNRPLNKFAVLFPLLMSFIVVMIIFFIDPLLLIDKDLNSTDLYDLFQVTIPDIYIIAVLIYAVKKARSVDAPSEKRTYLALGIVPVSMILIGGIQAFVMPESSIFCLGCTIVMVLFYIESMERRISLDPLTGLNNRSQLRRYVSQDSTLYREGLDTYMMMLDINDFKKINDTYGHAEGDRALVIMANALRKAVGAMDFRSFIARYGGDEFTVIAHTNSSAGLDALAEKIRSSLEEECTARKVPYTVTTGIGWSKLERGSDSVADCMKRADRMLYINKKEIKSGEAVQAS